MFMQGKSVSPMDCGGPYRRGVLVRQSEAKAQPRRKLDVGAALAKGVVKGFRLTFLLLLDFGPLAGSVLTWIYCGPVDAVFSLSACLLFTGIPNIAMDRVPIPLRPIFFLWEAFWAAYKRDVWRD